MNNKKQSMFVMSDGRNVLFTFALVSSLFLLWGFCNGMIDVMDKHFQEELDLTLSQSAWVQFAHYLGYFLMAMPAGWLAVKMGYKGGIIAGLLMVAVGGFWFIEAAKIAEFWAFLLGVCVIAAGLTFLETVANPYTTVLGPPRYAATRINLAQSCNGIGWILGPIAGGLFFYGTDEAGISTGSETLWIPYASVGVVVLVLALVFLFAPVPDVKAEDDYGLSKEDEPDEVSATTDRKVARVPVYFLLWFNTIVLVCVVGLIAWLALTTLDANISSLKLGERLADFAAQIPHPAILAITAENSLGFVIAAACCAVFLLLAVVLVFSTFKMSYLNIWSRPHFSGAVFAQFCYVAAQAGIFSFVINYMVWEVPPLPASWQRLLSGQPAAVQPEAANDSGQETAKPKAVVKESLIEVKTRIDKSDINNLPVLVERLRAKADPVSAFISGELSEATVRAMAAYDLAAAGKAKADAPAAADAAKADAPAAAGKKGAAGSATADVATLDDPVAADQAKLKPDASALFGQAKVDVPVASDYALRFHLARDLDDLVARDTRSAKKKKPTLYDAARFQTIPLQEETRQLIAQDPKGVDRRRLNRMLLADTYPEQVPFQDGILCFSNRAASFLATLGFICFLTGRFTGAGLLRKVSAHKIVGLYGVLNVLMCILIFCKLGWLSVLCVFLSYFFMSIMFPTIFALGIFGLGDRAKVASAFIVMAIMGGAMLPKVMGAVADRYDMSRSFIVPMFCFVVIALYGYGWPLLSKAKSLHGLKPGSGH